MALQDVLEQFFPCKEVACRLFKVTERALIVGLIRGCISRRMAHAHPRYRSVVVKVIDRSHLLILPLYFPSPNTFGLAQDYASHSSSSLFNLSCYPRPKAYHLHPESTPPFYQEELLLSSPASLPLLRRHSNKKVIANSQSDGHKFASRPNKLFLQEDQSIKLR